MEYSVKLSRLPEGVSFPERLRERIRFDAAHERLAFQGFMTKCTYDELSALTDDADYHRALEQLFVLTSYAVAPHSAKRSLPAAILLATIGAVVLVVGSWWMMTRQTASEPAASLLPQNVVSAAAR